MARARQLQPRQHGCASTLTSASDKKGDYCAQLEIHFARSPCQYLSYTRAKCLSQKTYYVDCTYGTFVGTFDRGSELFRHRCQTLNRFLDLARLLGLPGQIAREFCTRINSPGIVE